MKIGEKEFNFDADMAIDMSVLAANIGITGCAKKLIKELIKNSLPEPTGFGQKVIFKIGEYAFTAAIGTVIAERLSKAGAYAKFIRKGYLEAKKEMQKENNENGSSEPETEQQQVQEG